MEEFPASKVQPTNYNLTYWEVSQQQTYVQTLLAGLGVVIGQNSDLHLGGGGPLRRRMSVT